LRTVADLTPAERAEEFEQAIALVENAVDDLLASPRKYAELALQTAVANWNVSTESFAFLEGRYIEDISTVDPRLPEAHRKMVSFAEENGVDLDAIKHPTVAYLRKLDSVEPWKASFALVPLLNDRTQAKAETILLEVDYWLSLAEKNGDDLTGWSELVKSVVSILRPDFPVQADQLAALDGKYRVRSLARS
jgi:hypothetical protein